MSVSRAGPMATAAVVIVSWPGLEIAEVKVVRGKAEFPYVPGLLSFREVPLLLAAFRELALVPDLVLVDGQGRAHPRRFGLACHLGLALDRPAIGCAKSVLCGSVQPIGEEAGSRADITDGNETIGAALRTRNRVKPVYVSVGHKIDLPSALSWTMQCCRGSRIPEPLRLAHQAAGGLIWPGSLFRSSEVAANYAE